MDRQNSAAAVVWLKVTDYMQGWLLMEFGGEARIGDRKVVCMQHLEGIKAAMKMIAEKDQRLPGQPPIVMSAQLHNCITAGMELDNCALMQEYALTKETFEMYIPLEMPALRVTLDGVLRPWKKNITLGREQAAAVLRVIRAEFWQAVEAFDRDYARQHRDYAAIDMIEAWCMHTDTPDTYADAMRREWQRRQKRDKSQTPVANTDGNTVPVTQLI